MSVSLKEHLFNQNASDLRSWLKQIGAPLKGLTRKGQFIEAIQEQLTLHLGDVLDRMTPAEQSYLAESVYAGDLIPARAFAAKYGVPCPTTFSHHSWNEPVALLFPFIHRPNRWQLEGAGLIASLVKPLRRLLPKPDGMKVTTVDQLPGHWPAEQMYERGDPLRKLHVFESERIAPVELGRVLRLIQGGKVKLTAKGNRPTDAAARLVSRSLVVPDFDLEIPKEHRRDPWDKKYYTAAGTVRAHAWPVLVQQCGWARAKRGVLTLTDAGRDILQQFTPEKFRDGIHCYLNDGNFDELNRINHIRGQSGKAKRWMNDPGLRKPAIARSLAGLPVSAWLEFNQARRVAEASTVRWDVLPDDDGVLYFFSPQYGCIYDRNGVNRQFLRALLMESLATLGVVDVAFVYPHHLWPDLHESLNGDLPFCGRYDGLLFVRLNALGAFVLEATDHYETSAPEQTGLFRVLPNRDLVLTEHDLNPADRAMLELLAKPTGDQVWRLDAERMLSHVENGGTFTELSEYLETQAAAELPETVRTFLTEIEGRLDACRSVADAVLLAWTDTAQAQIIATSTGTRKYCYHAGDNRVVVPRKNLTAFRRALKKLGYVLPPTKA